PERKAVANIANPVRQEVSNGKGFPEQAFLVSRPCRVQVPLISEIDIDRRDKIPNRDNERSTPDRLWPHEDHKYQRCREKNKQRQLVGPEAHVLKEGSQEKICGKP